LKRLLKSGVLILAEVFRQQLRKEGDSIKLNTASLIYVRDV